MGLTFLKEYGARRSDRADAQSDQFGDQNAPSEEGDR